MWREQQKSGLPGPACRSRCWLRTGSSLRLAPGQDLAPHRSSAQLSAAQRSVPLTRTDQAYAGWAPGRCMSAAGLQMEQRGACAGAHFLSTMHGAGSADCEERGRAGALHARHACIDSGRTPASHCHLCTWVQSHTYVVASAVGSSVLGGVMVWLQRQGHDRNKCCRGL